MRPVFLAAAISAMAGMAWADGPSDPVIEPEVIEAETSSGGDEWFGLLMTLVVFGVAATK